MQYSDRKLYLCDCPKISLFKFRKFKIYFCSRKLSSKLQRWHFHVAVFVKSCINFCQRRNSDSSVAKVACSVYLNFAELGSFVEPMVWAYTSDLSRYFPPGMLSILAIFLTKFPLKPDLVFLAVRSLISVSRAWCLVTRAVKRTYKQVGTWCVEHCNYITTKFFF